PANQYLRQFPKDKVDQVCRFVAFISGAVAAVLALATLFDPELFLGFEVTPGRTAVFWLTIMVGVFGVAQGSLPDDDEVHDPVLHLKAVLYFTHYIPNHWKDRLHSTEVRSEFSALYQMKVLIFVEEILSLIVAPWILLRNAGQRSERIVDFFREQTVHVDGIGYQCNFAVFGFKKDPNAADPLAVLEEPDGLRDDYYGLRDDKMAASMQGFMQYYNHHSSRQGGRKQKWQPPPAWPPMLSRSAIAEETEVSTARPGAPSRHAGPKHSGLLDPRRPLHSVSPRLPAADRKPPSQQPDTRGKRPVAIETAEVHGVSESAMMRNDSDLHDVALPEKEAPESETDADDDAAEPVGQAGVLGMLYQYSRAQAEKGTGVRI
ncbi:autophagy protein atg9, partial [Teratosphaeriaceae sp. CCFEE 6253]